MNANATEWNSHWMQMEQMQHNDIKCNALNALWMHCKKCIVNAQVCVNAYQIKCIKCILNASQMKSQQNAKNKNAHGTSQNAVICRQMHLKGVGQKEHAFRAKRARHPVATRSHSLVTGGNTSYRARRASFLSTSRCTSLRISSRRCWSSFRRALQTGKGQS